MRKVLEKFNQPVPADAIIYPGKGIPVDDPLDRVSIAPGQFLSVNPNGQIAMIDGSILPSYNCPHCGKDIHQP